MLDVRVHTWTALPLLCLLDYARRTAALFMFFICEHLSRMHEIEPIQLVWRGGGIYSGIKHQTIFVTAKKVLRAGKKN